MPHLCSSFFWPSWNHRSEAFLALPAYLPQESTGPVSHMLLRLRAPARGHHSVLHLFAQPFPLLSSWGAKLSFISATYAARTMANLYCFINVLFFFSVNHPSSDLKRCIFFFPSMEICLIITSFNQGPEKHSEQTETDWLAELSWAVLERQAERQLQTVLDRWYGLNCVPAKKRCWNCNPRTSEGNLIQKECHGRCN